MESKIYNKADIENILNDNLNTFSGNLCPKSAEARERLIRCLDRRFAALLKTTNATYYGCDIDENDVVAVCFMVNGQLAVFEY